jgi:hypothetical protein
LRRDFSSRASNSADVAEVEPISRWLRPGWRWIHNNAMDAGAAGVSSIMQDGRGIPSNSIMWARCDKRAHVSTDRSAGLSKKRSNLVSARFRNS